MAVDLHRLLAPASIAVVGANETPGSYASQALINLAEIGYKGRIYGVNPKREQAFGHPCFPTVAELPEAVDALFVAIPAAAVPPIIEQAGAYGCGGAVVISAGFAEVPSGRELQRELIAAAARHAFPVCGPNCNGIIAMHTASVLWGDTLAPREPGHVAMISQSGNVAVNAINARRGLRFHTVIASGNQAVLHASDYLESLVQQEGVRSIAMYLEDDGGPALCDGIAACAEAGVAVVVHKVGSSPAGARAAAAHSAALAGDQRIFRALIDEAGAFWADDVHELLELSKTLATPGRGRGGRRLAIMTCSGGDSAQGADESHRQGLELPDFSPPTIARLREVLPSAATAANPLDYTAMIWGEREAIAELVRIIGEDPSIDEVLVFYDEPEGMTGAPAESWGAVRDGIIDGAHRSPVPTLVSSTLPELLDDGSAWRFIEAGIPAAAGLRTGVRCAAVIADATPSAWRAARLRAIAKAAAAVPRPGPGDGTWLSEHAAKELLRDHGVPVVEGRLVGDPDDAVAALGELGGRVVMKLSAALVQHKTELGAVELSVETPERARSAFARLAALAGDYGDDARVLVERMASATFELLVAAHTDGIVPAVVIGLGGIWTEILDDVVVVPLPADPERVAQGLRSLRGAALLTGARGREPADIASVAALASTVGEILLEQHLDVLECNPVFVGSAGEGAIAVDATARRRAEH